MRKVPFNDIVFHDNATGTLGSFTSVRLPDDYFSRRPRYYYDGNRTEIEAVFLPKHGDLAHTRTVNDNVFEGPEKFTFILAILYPSFVTLKDNKNQHTVTVYDNDGMSSTFFTILYSITSAIILLGAQLELRVYGNCLLWQHLSNTWYSYIVLLSSFLACGGSYGTDN